MHVTLVWAASLPTGMRLTRLTRLTRPAPLMWGEASLRSSQSDWGDGSAPHYGNTALTGKKMNLNSGKSEL